MYTYIYIYIYIISIFIILFVLMMITDIVQCSDFGKKKIIRRLSDLREMRKTKI